jgi:hypothetical protein
LIVNSVVPENLIFLISKEAADQEHEKEYFVRI